MNQQPMHKVQGETREQTWFILPQPTGKLNIHSIGVLFFITGLAALCYIESKVSKSNDIQIAGMLLNAGWALKWNPVEN